MRDDWTALEGGKVETVEAGDEPVESEEGRQVREWRLAQFAGLGFGLADALLLGSSNVDLGETRKLIGLGCPARTAAEILL